MSDSDMDDDFLLEALEKVEQTQGNTSVHLTLSGLEDIKSTVSSPTTLNDLPYKQNSNDENNDNFRANLLKSLKTCRTNVINSKVENHFGDPVSSIKRKNEDKELKKFLEELEPQSQKQNKIITSRNLNDFENPNKDDSKIFESRSNIVSSFNSPISTIVKKRKFPGPAGILPEFGQRGARLKMTDDKTSQFNNNQVQDSVCSQTTAEDFISGLWKEMILDLNMLTDSRSLLQCHNIRSTLRKNTLRSQTCIRKISFLVVMVKCVDISHQDATAVFHDETGEIQGTISESVLEKYGSHIASGTVFILKDSTILSPGLFQQGMGVMGQLKKHYLTVTTNSIISIYSSNDDGQNMKVKVVNLTKEGLKTLLSTDDGFRERTELIENEENEQFQQQPTLFQNIGSENKYVQSFRNQSNIPEYKSPVNVCTNIHSVPKPKANFSKNISNAVNSVPSMGRPVSNSTSLSKTNLGSRIPSIPKLSTSCSSATFQPHSKSLNTEPHRQSKSFSFNSSNNKIPNENSLNNPIQAASDAFASFSDDEEFDSLLASINTDVL